MKTIDDALKYADTFDSPHNQHMSIVMLASEVRRLRDEINGLTGSLDRAEKALKEAQEQEPVAWMHDKDGRVDTCHDSVKKLWLKVGQQQNTQFMREIVPCRVEHYNIPLYARPVPANLAESHQIKRDSNSPEFDGIKTATAVAVPAIDIETILDASTATMCQCLRSRLLASEVRRLRALLQSNGCSSQTQNEVRHD